MAGETGFSSRQRGVPVIQLSKLVLKSKWSPFKLYFSDFWRQPGQQLFLIYINDLPNSLNIAQPRLFADDTSKSCASNSLDEIQYAIKSDLENLNNWLVADKLSLNKAKTEFMIIGSRQKINVTQNDLTIVIVK